MPDLSPDDRALARRIADAAEPLPDLGDPEFGAALDRFGDCRVVLLGEASHGTAEFYRARAAITARLIARHGFSLVAVEADWPDAAAFDRRVRGTPAQEADAHAFRRFPTWMWRNAEVEDFLGWLRRHNQGLAPEARAAFRGLDLYNLSAAMRAVIDYLDGVDPEAAAEARRRYGCLEPWRAEPEQYGALGGAYARCAEGVAATLRELCARQETYGDGEGFLDASQNARLVRDAERYYRAMYAGGAESWNLRDRHMADTLFQLLDWQGAKAVVWAHNSHIGDASRTEMGRRRGELNLGQLCRERFGAQAALVGFGTHTGSVACASDWDEPMEVKRVNPSRPDSYEALFHEAGRPRCLLDLREGVHDSLREALTAPRLERFIGVIYRPETERWSHYMTCTLPEQFDALLWFDETRAVTPLPVRREAGMPETAPTGL